MISKSAFALVAAIAAVGVASSASAQSFDPDMGTGNIVSANTGSSTVSAPRNGLDAYAMVPRQHTPAIAGGSSGYEQLLKQQW